MPVVWLVVGALLGTVLGGGMVSVFKDGDNAIADWVMEVGGYVINQLVAALFLGAIVYLITRFT